MVRVRALCRGWSKEGAAVQNLFRLYMAVVALLEWLSSAGKECEVVD